MAAIAEPVAKHIINPVFGTEFTSKEFKPLWVAGYPSNYGGADTELMAQIYLWRKKGLEVNLVPMFGCNEETRKTCDALGCTTHDYKPSIFKGRVVVSFCNGEFLTRLPEIYANGKPEEVIWLNCMTWLFDKEKTAHANGLITKFAYQTQYQMHKLSAELSHIRSLNVMPYKPYYSVEHNPQGIKFSYRAPEDYFGVGRVSRDDGAKYSSDTWKIFAGVVSPKPVKAFILGYGQNAAQKCGKPPEGLDWQTWQPGAISAGELYGRIHALIHCTGGSRENYPRTILEAWNAGVVPIFEKAWGLPEIIDNGVDGFLCSSPAEMSERASQLAHDEAMRRRMVYAGYEKLTQEIANVESCWGPWRDLLQIK